MYELLALTYPNIDPVALHIGPLSIKWYGLAYAAGLLLGWFYARRLVSQPQLWSPTKPPMPIDRVDDLLLAMTLAIVVGGRLGQVLLYDPGYYFENPAEIVKVWKGGMSFHGAFIACALTSVVFARLYNVPFRSLTDLICAVTPFGLFFGRVANFINSEHWGRVTDASIGMVFPNGGLLLRHPSQLYEAALEGLVMLGLIVVAVHYRRALGRPGLVTGLWLSWYAIARSICEFFREPEPIHALNIEPFTAGQLYSLPMLLLGLYFIWSARQTPLAQKAAS